MLTTPSPVRNTDQKSVLGLTCDPIKNVRIGMVGLGVRATRAIKRFMHIEGIEIKAICDIVPLNIKQAQEILTNNNKSKAIEYIGEDSWKNICEQDDLDLIYICTDWKTHTSIAVYAMEHGKHVGVEVPASTTIAECWKLVDTAEKYQKHCMMLENCCYDRFELATLNMAQQGLFGEVIHVEGAYIHDLRERIFSNEFGMRRAGNWQAQYNVEHTGNPYPTHGLGPVCQVLNMHRGDKMNYLVSMSTKSAGMALYAQEIQSLNSSNFPNEYKLGDMNNTLISTELGKTILIQHDIFNPRPYSRLHLITGTRGYSQKYPVEQFAFYPDSDTTLNPEKKKELLEKYDHPLWQQLGDKAKKVCGERARDFIMDYRLIYCLQNGLPLDQDVYDAAEWSCLVELTEISVKNNSRPILIPDFTRGEWKKLKGLQFAE